MVAGTLRGSDLCGRPEDVTQFQLPCACACARAPFIATVKLFLSEFHLLSPVLLCLRPAATNSTIPDSIRHTDPAEHASLLRHSSFFFPQTFDNKHEV